MISDEDITEVVKWDMLEEIGVVEVEVTVLGELMGDGACVLVLEVCEAVVVELELEVDVDNLKPFSLVVALSLFDRL